MPHNLSRLKKIRILIDDGPGYGHQTAAITLMLRLRELGFLGHFEICYFTCGVRNQIFTSNRNGSIPEKLEKLIVGFKEDQLGCELVSPTLGKIIVRSLLQEATHLCNVLSPVTLTMSAAGQFYFAGRLADAACGYLNTRAYVQLQPTDYNWSTRYISIKDAESHPLPENIRLGAPISNDKPPKESWSKTLLDILSVCENPKVNTQFLYGLASAEEFVHPANECTRLANAYEQLGAEKKLIVFIPYDELFIGRFFPYKFLPLMALSSVNLDSLGVVTFVLTGDLPRWFFHWLMLEKTSLPPVIEGQNAQEICEAAGRFFIQGGRFDGELLSYSVPEDLQAHQDLHLQASGCLKAPGKVYDVNLSPLVSYMKKALAGELTEYFVERQRQFLARPDACLVVLDHLKSILEATNLNLLSRNPSAFYGVSRTDPTDMSSHSRSYLAPSPAGSP